MEANPIRVLDPWQVWDDRGCFYVGLKRDAGKKHHGLPVYVDAFGVRLVIRGAS